MTYVREWAIVAWVWIWACAGALALMSILLKRKGP